MLVSDQLRCRVATVIMEATHIGEGRIATTGERLHRIAEQIDAATAAVEADNGPSTATRQAVLDAHLAICILKTKTA